MELPHLPKILTNTNNNEFMQHVTFFKELDVWNKHHTNPFCWFVAIHLLQWILLFFVWIYRWYFVTVNIQSMLWQFSWRSFQNSATTTTGGLVQLQLHVTGILKEMEFWLKAVSLWADSFKEFGGGCWINFSMQEKRCIYKDILDLLKLCCVIEIELSCI